jgi:hypothetical protein
MTEVGWGGSQMYVIPSILITTQNKHFFVKREIGKLQGEGGEILGYPLKKEREAFDFFFRS